MFELVALEYAHMHICQYLMIINKHKQIILRKHISLRLMQLLYEMKSIKLNDYAFPSVYHIQLNLNLFINFFFIRFEISSSYLIHNILINNMPV